MWEMRAGLEDITPREQQQNGNPNCSLLASLITADLHFYEWLSAGIKVGCRQGKRGEAAGLPALPMPRLGWLDAGSGLWSRLSACPWGYQQTPSSHQTRPDAGVWSDAGHVQTCCKCSQALSEQY